MSSATHWIRCLLRSRTVAAAAGKSSKSVAKNKHLGGIDIPNRWKIISMLYQLPSPALIC